MSANAAAIISMICGSFGIVSRRAAVQAAQSDVDGGGEQENHQLKYHDKEIFVVAAEQGDIEQP